MEQRLVIDPQIFRRILNRNVVWPLTIGVLSAVFFVAIIYYLLSISSWVENTDLVVRRVNEVIKLCLDRETGLRGYVITGNEEFLEPYQRARVQIKPQLENIKDLVGENSDQQQRLDKILLLADRWGDYAAGIVALRAKNGDSGEASSAVQAGVGKKVMDELRGDFNDFLLGEEQIKAARYASAKTTVYVLVGLFLLFSIAFAALLAYLGRRDLLNLSSTYIEVMQRQTQHAEVLQRQAWLRSGQTQLADRIIGQLSLVTVCGNILQFLSEYLDASVGALYVIESGASEPGAVLKRAATYAFSADNEKQPQSFRIGESLVGQAALQRRTLHLHAVPADYLQISSGLGRTEPTSVLVVPVSADREVNAVIELGFLRVTGAREFDLLEALADNIGTAIAAANYRQRLQVVLWDTQQLNETLQAQQEELRAANEALEEQARALEESQQLLENQHSELEQTNEQLEQQAAALEHQRDALNDKNSELQQAQYLLQERAAELERASRYKSEFLANMSHELRTPLNSTLILAKLLSDNGGGNLSAEQVKFAHSIYAAGNDLLDLINDILDISKVEAGRLEIRADNIALAKFIDTLDSTFRPLAAAKAIRFTVARAVDLPPTIFSDPKRLAQIVKNLLSNAIKFTDSAGQVELQVRLHSPQQLAIVVKDSGIGIAKEHQQAIFDAFRQGDGTTNRKYGGTGLGLSISRDLAHLLGGSIEVQSEPGRGSEFTLLLPLVYREANAPMAWQQLPPAMLAVPPAPIAAPTHTVAARPRHTPIPFADDRDSLSSAKRTLLIIEDEPKFAEILFDLAHQQHFNALVAGAADEGFDAALRYLPNAILLDMKLPDHSGMTVLERLKSNAKTRHIPVHIISVEDNSEAALLMGAIGYLTKPASRDALKNTLDKLAAKIDQKVKRVLVVEDDARQREGIELLIGDDDIDITGVAHGAAALELLKEQVFDCMIIDLQLPDMSGADLLQRMTTAQICSFPPVIVYTAQNLGSADEAELLRYSRSIIIKGARSPERLLDEVMLFLHKIESELSVDRQQMLKQARHRERVFEGRKILVVDDDVRNIFALTSALEQKGAQVKIGRNGREALEKLAQISDIDLVLMDIMMPEMDGYEAIRRIRAEPRLARLPIIAVTAKAMRDDHERCLQVGANDYLAKPIDLDRLLSLIRVWMPQIQRL